MIFVASAVLSSYPFASRYARDGRVTTGDLAASVAGAVTLVAGAALHVLETVGASAVPTGSGTVLAMLVAGPFGLSGWPFAAAAAGLLAGSRYLSADISILAGSEDEPQEDGGESGVVDPETEVAIDAPTVRDSGATVEERPDVEEAPGPTAASSGPDGEPPGGKPHSSDGIDTIRTHADEGGAGPFGRVVLDGIDRIDTRADGRRDGTRGDGSWTTVSESSPHSTGGSAGTRRPGTDRQTEGQSPSRQGDESATDSKRDPAEQVRAISSALDRVGSFVEAGEREDARAVLDEIDSRLDPLRRRASRGGNGDLQAAVEKLERRHRQFANAISGHSADGPAPEGIDSTGRQSMNPDENRAVDPQHQQSGDSRTRQPTDSSSRQPTDSSSRQPTHSQPRESADSQRQQPAVDSTVESHVENGDELYARARSLANDGNLDRAREVGQRARDAYLDALGLASDHPHADADEIERKVETAEQLQEAIDRVETKRELRAALDGVRQDLGRVDDLVIEGDFEAATRELSDVRSTLDALERNAATEELEELRSEVADLREACDEWLSRDHVLRVLREMDEYDFEELVARVWDDRGWETDVTADSGDRGIDVVAEREDPFYQKQLIQAKRYTEGNRIGSEEVRNYSTLKDQEERVDAVVIVTTSSFTSPAEELAADLNVKLVDGDSLYDLLAEDGGAED